MDILEERRRRREEDDPIGRILSGNRFELVVPDALNVEPRESESPRMNLKDRYRLLDDIGRKIPFQARTDATMEAIDVPGKRVGVAEKVARKGLGIAKRTFFDPLVPGKTVAKLAERVIPATAEPSEILGRGLSKALTVAMDTPEARLREHFKGQEPNLSEVLRARPKRVELELGPVKPSKVVEEVAEFGMTPAEALPKLMGGGIGLAFLGASLADKAKDASKVAKKVGQISEQMREIQKAEKLAETNRSLRVPEILMEKKPPSFLDKAKELLERPKEIKVDPLVERADRQRHLMDIGEEQAADLSKIAEARREAEIANLAESQRGLLIGKERVLHASPEGVGLPYTIDTYKPGKEAAGAQTEAIGRKLAKTPMGPVRERTRAQGDIARAMEAEAKAAPLQLPAPPAIQKLADLPDRGLLSSARDTISRPGLAKLYAQTDAFLRKQGLTEYADAGRNLQVEQLKLVDEGVRGVEEAFKVLANLPKAQRARAEMQVARFLDTGTFTDSPALDEIGLAIKAWQKGRLAQVREALAGSGAVINEKEWYLPHINDNLPDILKKYQRKDEAGALADLKALYVESGYPADKIPPDKALLSVMADIHNDRISRVGQGTNTISRAPNVENPRDINLPGFIADYRSKNYKPGDLARAYARYNEQTAFRIADAKQFGPNAEKLDEWLATVRDPAMKQYALDHREHLLSAWSGNPLDEETASLLTAWRSWNAANKLGRAVVSNAFQTLATTLPKSVSKGPGSAINGLVNYAQAVGRSFKNREEETAWARSIGALYNSSVDEIASLGDTGVISEFARGVLKYTGFSATEHQNNLISAIAGRLYGEDLAREIATNGKQAKDAIRESARLLQASPELAEAFVKTAASGQPVPKEILDRMGYEFARLTQFRADPTALPLSWVGPTGKAMAQFQSFTFNYGRFVRDEVIGGLAKGDVAPAVAWLGSGLVFGPAVNYIRRFVSGEEDVKEFHEYLTNAEKRNELPAKVLDHYAKIETALNGVQSMGGLGLISNVLEGNVTPVPIREVGRAYGDIRGVVTGEKDATLPIVSRLPLGPIVPWARRAAKGEPVFGFDVDMPDLSNESSTKPGSFQDAINRRKAARR